MKYFFYIILIFYYANRLSFIIEKCQSYQNLYESNKNLFFEKLQKRAVLIDNTPYNRANPNNQTKIIEKREDIRINNNNINSSK